MILCRALIAAVGAAHLVAALNVPLEQAAHPLPTLLDATLDELRQGLDSGIFTSSDLVKAYLARIDETNLELHAVTEVNPDALAIAEALDKARGGRLMTDQPLYGIPILLKDNIATNDKMNNTAGCEALLGAKVPEDSTVAARLRAAGAIILGKANMDQWAGFEQSGPDYGGKVVGAYSPRQYPMGSSSGSAVAASIGLAWATVGTDTTGSITGPAGANNIVGLRPTLGLVPRHLVIPYSEHFDTVGPMARTVKDAAYLLSAIAGPDERDNYTSAFPFSQVPNYVGACNTSGLKGKRIGHARYLHTNVSCAVDESALKVLRNAGAEIVDIAFDGRDDGRTMDRLQNVLSDHYLNIAQIDFKANLAEYFSKLITNPNNITSTVDLVRYTQDKYPNYWNDPANSGHLPYLETPPLNNSEASRLVWGNFSRMKSAASQYGFSAAFNKGEVDAFVIPFCDTYNRQIYANGQPFITVPFERLKDDRYATDKNGLMVYGTNYPMGITFLGPQWSEEQLLGIAYAFEQETMFRKNMTPYIKPTSELEARVRRRALRS
ncbi:amidase [Hirsutella rhossiliensis]|uniref:Amidase domain-containing protein n=1 Tax=Hirsutella rhossiliensis TaxID=111463 RepID=A0A9P8SLM5_9HYPO|nr:amidase domain-containing protein [Hirsutella rhossiliensis]KAH0966424.1 amidase domain-containing protein [Hirsutella rhossiliensis]